MGKYVTNCAVEVCFFYCMFHRGNGGEKWWKREREREAFHRQVEAISGILKLLQRLYLIIQGIRP